LNEALNTIHSKKRFEGLSGDYQSDEKTGDDVVQESELSHALDSALRELKLDYRLVIILNHFHDRSYTEMSYILNIPVKTVKSRLFTARNMLRELLVHNR
jgi:RNA polymerase sigma-70 factor (ECF subfamily)